jgi:hypothetical protein
LIARESARRLAALLETGQALAHPFVVGEPACGNLAKRVELLRLLCELSAAVSATDDEVVSFVERHRLMGAGIGWTSRPDSEPWPRLRRPQCGIW